MKRISLQLIPKTLLLFCLLLPSSCKNMLDIAPEGQVDASNNYRNIYDANAAVIGIYGQLMTIADRYIVLNELRADLMIPTANADQFLREINTHTVSANNPWADPKPFYKIILNCNDALKNFDIMLQESKFRREEYNQRYADVAAVRAWLYLQLGIHWGSVPYVTDALENVDDLRDENKFPRIPFNDMLDKLISTLNNGYLDTYTTSTSTTGSTSTSLNTTVDGYATNLFFINKRCLLGDLYLWRGKYSEAAAQYRYVSDTGFRNDQGATATSFFQYKANSGTLLINYLRPGDETSLIDDNTNTTGWRAIFGGLPGTDINAEWIWTLPFDKNFQPANPFIDLFSNQGGRYLLTASKLALDDWNSQTQRNGFPYDARGRLSVRTINGQPVIAKQLYYYLNGTTLLPINVLQKQGRWLLYRAGTLNLHFAEAACRDNYVDVAYALTNAGVYQVFSGVFPATVNLDGSNRNIPADVTNIMTTGKPAPYDLDARSGDVPYYRSPWYRQIGTRTRANLTNLPSSLINGGPNKGGDITLMENAIIEEDGRELAFEGQRWGDLLRVALRRNDRLFLAEKVYQKLLREGNPEASAAKNKLLTENGLYLPFKL